MRNVCAAIFAAACLAAAGCDSNAAFVTPARLDRGLAIILPGVEGHSPFNNEIRRGLDRAGVPYAMPIHDWGRPIPLAGPIINQLDVAGNRLAGRRLADMIVEYQDSYPGRPVYLVGHSAGGGIAVFAAESLPQGRQVDGLVLLSPSVSARYDLTEALEHTRQGIVSFYSWQDFAFLIIGTTLAGNVDGWRGPAGGAIGFDKPPDDAPDQRKQAYARLFQVPLTLAMTGLVPEPHLGSTGASFTAKYVAPWILARDWPADQAQPPAEAGDDSQAAPQAPEDAGADPPQASALSLIK